jgi:excisionase family DNA binding protein
MLDAEPVARALNISTTSLYKLARGGELPFSVTKIGRLYRFKRVEVEAFLGAPLDEVLGAASPVATFANEFEVAGELATAPAIGFEQS